MEKREPHVHEGPKVALFVRGSTASQLVQSAMGDLVWGMGGGHTR